MLKLQNIYSSIKNKYFLLSIVTIFTSNLLSQNIPTDLAEEFLEGLPPSVRGEIEVQNDLALDKELESLFRADTSIEKNKVILQKIRDQLNAIENRFSEDADDSDDELQIFGSSFFQTLQSSFMPVNLPNMGPEYILDVGDKLNLLLTGSVSDMLEISVMRDGSVLIPDFGKVILLESPWMLQKK